MLLGGEKFDDAIVSPGVRVCVCAYYRDNSIYKPHPPVVVMKSPPTMAECVCVRTLVCICKDQHSLVGRNFVHVCVAVMIEYFE